MSDVWTQIKRVRILIQSEDIDYLNSLVLGVKDLGLNVNELDLIVWVEDEELKKIIASKVRCVTISAKDFNWLGNLKNDKQKTILSADKDLTLLIGKIPRKFVKLIGFKRSKFVCSLNENSSFAQINLETEKQNGREQLSFLKDTLSKIALG